MAKNVHFSISATTVLGPHPVSFQKDTGSCFPGGKAAGSEVDHSPVTIHLLPLRQIFLLLENNYVFVSIYHKWTFTDEWRRLVYRGAPIVLKYNKLVMNCGDTHMRLILFPAKCFQYSTSHACPQLTDEGGFHGWDMNTQLQMKDISWAWNSTEGSKHLL
jgi:hypothetical protein